MRYLLRSYLNVNFEVYEVVTDFVELFHVFNVSLKSTSNLTNRYLSVWKCVNFSEVIWGDILEKCIKLDLTSH